MGGTNPDGSPSPRPTRVVYPGGAHLSEVRASMVDRETGHTGEPWRRLEVDAVVAGYAVMLRKELRGERYSKADAVRELQVLLPARSATSIERKLQNISAVLDETGLDWIDGYKPLAHYQRELKAAVLDVAGPGHRLGEALADYGSSPLVAARARRLATDDVVVGSSGSRAPTRMRTSVGLTGSALSGLRDFQARKLGVTGEEWVVDLEREKLTRLGRRDLADRVVWVAHDLGDGAGYDVSSFRDDGRERLIEVKTTNHGPRTPFYITRWEIEVSRRNPDVYSLYRVHGFARDPRIYILDGSVEERARLEAKVFLGFPI